MFDALNLVNRFVGPEAAAFTIKADDRNLDELQRVFGRAGRRIDGERVDGDRSKQFVKSLRDLLGRGVRKELRWIVRKSGFGVLEVDAEQLDGRHSFHGLAQVVLALGAA